MRPIRALILLAGSGLFQSAWADDPASAEAKKLEGEWKLVSGQFHGQTSDLKDPLQPDDYPTWTIQGTKFTHYNPAKDGWVAFKLDPDKTPKEIDPIRRPVGTGRNRTTRGIYKLVGDRLIICSPSDDLMDRLKEFDAGIAGQSFVIVLKRREMVAATGWWIGEKPVVQPNEHGRDPLELGRTLATGLNLAWNIAHTHVLRVIRSFGIPRKR